MGARYLHQSYATLDQHTALRGLRKTQPVAKTQFAVTKVEIQSSFKCLSQTGGQAWRNHCTVDTSKGEEAHAEVSVFPSLCLDPQGMSPIAVSSWRVSLVLDFLLLSRRHHKISQSAETLASEFFLGEASLYQLRRDHNSDLRAGFLHAVLLPCMKERTKYLWYSHTSVCCCKCILESSNQEEKEKQQKTNV